MAGMSYTEARRLREDEGCTCSISGILDRRGHFGRCPSRKADAPNYTTASYTFQEGTSKAGETVTGVVVKQGKTYADVTWETGRTERVHFTEKDVRFK